MPTKRSSRALLACLPLLLIWGCSSSAGSGAAEEAGGAAGADDYGHTAGTGDALGGSAGSSTLGPAACRNDLSGAVGVAVNGQASCALLKQGTVSCWGDGSISGYGTGTLMESETPADVMISHATALTRGLTSICASIEGGSAECWQDVLLFAQDAPIPALRPVAIPAVQGAKEIAHGSDHLCMLFGDATVACLGSNEHSQLGTGKTYNDLELSAVMVPVKGLSGVTHISAGDDFTCALLQGGTVSCWGDIPGQAGDPNFDGYPSPVAVPALNGVTAVAATSADHVCALLKDGSVACWGENSHHESGGDSADPVILPVIVEGVSNATAVSIGDDVSCAIDRDGRVLCWGDDFLGGSAHADAQPIGF